MNSYFCVTCQQHFHSVSAFDMHRIGEYSKQVYNEQGKAIGRTPDSRRCMTPAEMLEKGMVRSNSGKWICNRFDEQARERVRF